MNVPPIRGVLVIVPQHLEKSNGRSRFRSDFCAGKYALPSFGLRQQRRQLPIMNNCPKKLIFNQIHPSNQFLNSNFFRFFKPENSCFNGAEIS
jgi:hypothetical protein